MIWAAAQRRTTLAAALAQHRAREFRHGLAAGGGDRDRKLGGFAFDRVAPVVVVIADLEQPVARAQRALQRRHPAGMLGIDRQHQPVEEAPPLRSGAHEQPVHRRRQPDHAQMIAEGGRRERRTGSRSIRDSAGWWRPPRLPAHRCRSRAWRVRARPRPRRIPPRNRRPGCRRHPPCVARRIGRRRPGDRNEIASRQLVLPAPFGPTSATTSPRACRRAGDLAVDLDR